MAMFGLSQWISLALLVSKTELLFPLCVPYSHCKQRIKLFSKHISIKKCITSQKDLLYLSLKSTKVFSGSSGSQIVIKMHSCIYSKKWKLNTKTGASFLSGSSLCWLEERILAQLTSVFFSMNLTIFGVFLFLQFVGLWDYGWRPTFTFLKRNKLPLWLQRKVKNMNSET